MFSESLATPIGSIRVLADDKELLSIALSKASIAPRPNAISSLAIAQLEEYFLGTRRHFDLPLKLLGTEFQQAVWRALTKIDFAKVASYSAIALDIGRPKAVRAVGAANHRNNFPIVIPCHRVLGKDGKLTGYALGLEKKAWLLEHEKAVDASTVLSK